MLSTLLVEKRKAIIRRHNFGLCEAKQNGLQNNSEREMKIIKIKSVGIS